MKKSEELKKACIDDIKKSKKFKISVTFDDKEISNLDVIAHSKKILSVDFDPNFRDVGNLTFRRTYNHCIILRKMPYLSPSEVCEFGTILQKVGQLLIDLLKTLDEEDKQDGEN